jgi:hypothetical protein
VGVALAFLASVCFGVGLVIALVSALALHDEVISPRVVAGAAITVAAIAYMVAAR